MEELDNEKYFYVRANVLKPGETNGNGDVFEFSNVKPEQFIGKHICVNFECDDPEKIIGETIDAYKNNDNLQIVAKIEKTKFDINKMDDVSVGYGGYKSDIPGNQ